ncbi:molybdopterin biosynthesis protein [Pseudothermotoga sp.]|uniref:molybdopterin biosynthesis protein n=1 Tax=Pseudothermotoga sp. TaxID=2033661 RepID=UPI0031F5F055
MYLKKMDLDQVLKRYLERLRDVGFFERKVERVKTRDALGRTLASAVFAHRSVPHYNAAAVDGIAVRSVDTIGASKHAPKKLTKDRYEFVNTGQPIREGFDAVIMIEDVHFLQDSSVQVFEPVPQFHNVRLIGEDVVEYDMLFPRYHRLAPQDLALLLAAGVFEVDVLKKMKCVVVPTGDEIVDPTAELKEGLIPETNSLLVKAFLEKLGAEVAVFQIVKDDVRMLEEALHAFLPKSDMLLFIGGSSAGEKDFVYRLLEKTGEVFAHGLNLRPGKPTVLSIVEKKPVIGLPGFPSSCFTVLERIVRPIIDEWYGRRDCEADFVEAESVRRVHSFVGEDEIVRGVVAKVKERYVFVPLKRGSAVMSSLSRMNGTLVVPKGEEVIEEGQKVWIKLESSKCCIDDTVLFVGSNDPLVDRLVDLLCERKLNLTVVSVGSLGGVRAIARAQAHLGGIHLFDPETETYNLPYLRKMLNNFVLVKFAKRLQGIVVQKGNPKSIKTLYDLARSDVKFINRQKASGTRILLDYYLEKLGIEPSKINGYENEESTHIGVALKVKKGLADAGLAVAYVAKLMDLDFVPICWEDYDLLILPEFFEDERFKIILDVTTSNEFRNLASAYAGYDISEAGKIILEGREL